MIGCFPKPSLLAVGTIIGKPKLSHIRFHTIIRAAGCPNNHRFIAFVINPFKYSSNLLEEVRNSSLSYTVIARGRSGRAGRAIVNLYHAYHFRNKAK